MVAIAEKLDLHGELASSMSLWVRGRVPAPREVLAEGPAGTGKTRTILEFLLNYAETYPGSKIVFIRNERSSMSETMLVEWEDHVFGPLYPELVRGQMRKDREKYGPLKNRSEFILRGFDNEQKLFSGQYHVIYFNEATELKSEEKWETLHTRLRAVKAVPNQPRMMIADCNPRQRMHWLNVRAQSRMCRIRTKLADNPRWYDHTAMHLHPDDRWTEEGREYIQALSLGLTGFNRTRFLLGEWEDATGALMPEFSADRHVIEARLERAQGTWLLHVKGWPNVVELRWFFAGFDAGYTTAVMGIWGVDIQGRMFEVAEIYRSHWTHQDWAQRAVGLAREFQLQGIVSDHDPALIEAVNRALINAGYGACVREADKRMGTSGDKAKDARIEMVRARFQRGELFYVKGCNRESDPALAQLKRPTSTPEEIPSLRYREYEYGVDDVKQEGKVDKSIPDHGFDMTAYSVVYAAGRQVQGERKLEVSPFERYWSGDWKGYAKAR